MSDGDQFLRAVTASGLMTAAEVRAFVDGLPPEGVADGQTLAREFVRAQKLTRYQAARLLRGEGDGLVLGNYVVLDQLGAGGMGQVFKARHRRMKRLVALKVLPPALVNNEAALRRFEREVEAAAQLSHPNIVTAHDADEAAGQRFLVMECVEGRDLAALVKDQLAKKQGPLAVDQAIDCIIQAARGLEHAHKRGIIHRDVKPSNLLIDAEGTVKVLDMGLARVEVQEGTDGVPDEHTELTQTGIIMGTVDYMAPEQAASTRHADARADIYSLGCTLHYLLTGRPPFTGENTLRKLVAHRTAPIPPLSTTHGSVPAELEAAYRRMLAKQPDERFANMTEVIIALERCRGGATAASVKPATLWTPPADEPELADFLAGLAQPEAAPRRVAAVAADDAQVETLGEESAQRTRAFVPAMGAGAADAAKPAARPTGAKRKQTVLAIAAAVIAVPLLLALALSLGNFNTAPARVILDIDQPGRDLRITVNGQPVPINDFRTTEPVEFDWPPGTYELRVEKAGLLPYTAVVQLKPGKAERIVVALAKDESAEIVEVGPDPDREVAVWVLSLGGRAIGFDRDEKHFIASADAPLPQGRIRLTTVDLTRTAVANRNLARAARVPGLQHVYLAETRIGDAGLAHLRDLKEVQQLYFAGSQVTDAGLANITDWKHLVILQLDGTHVADQGLRHLRGCTELRQLSLDGTKVSDAGMEHLATLPGLTSLALGGTNVTDRGVAALDGLRRLSDLHLSNLQVTDEAFPHLASHDALQDLWLWNTKVSGARLADLAACPELWNLRLSACPLSDDRLAGLRELRSVTTLMLEDTPITDDGLAHLAAMKQLLNLDISRIQFTDGGVEQLHRDLPGCRIVWGQRVFEPPADPDERVALWVHGLGGRLTLRLADGQEREIAPEDELPDVKRAKVVAVDLRGVGAANGHMAPLSHLSEMRELFLTGAAVSYEGANRLNPHGTLKLLERLDLAGTRVVDLSINSLSDLVTLRDLDLADTRVTDGCMPFMGRMVELERLSLAGCQITDRSLDYVANHQTLQSLDLSRTLVTAAGVPKLAGLPDLRTLELANTTIGDEAIEPLAGLSALTVLDLRKTLLTTDGIARLRAALPSCEIEWSAADPRQATVAWILRVGGKLKVESGGTRIDIATPDALPTEPFTVVGINVGGLAAVNDAALAQFGQFAELAELELSLTGITDAGLAHIAGLTSLTHLNLYETKITDDGLRHLGQLRALRYLALERTSVTDGGLAHLPPLPDLEVVALAATNVIGPGLATFRGSPKLRMLEAHWTPLDDAGLAEIAELKSLEILKVFGTRISDLGIEHLRSLQNLTYADLRDTALTDKSVDALTALTNLQTVQLTGTQITDEGKRRLRQALPNCTIH